MNTSVTPSTSQEGISLSDEQRDELTEQYVELVVDNMDMDNLIIYAQEQLTAYYNEGSLDDLKEDIDNYDDELFDELVDNVIKS